MSFIGISISGTLAGGLLTTGAIGAGIGGALALTSGGPDVKNEFLQNPEYPNSQDARDLWWNKLQDWGKDPNYGAISPDWNDIWDQTQKQVKDYYNGTALQPGVQDQINSSLARRGMSENPASDFLHAQVGATESRNLSDLSAQQNIAKQTFANQGQQNWLTSLQNFQAQKPAGQWNTTVTPNPQQTAAQAISSIGGAVGSAGATLGSLNNQTAYLNYLTNQNSPGPTTFSSSSTAPSNLAPYQHPIFL